MPQARLAGLLAQQAPHGGRGGGEQAHAVIALVTQHGCLAGADTVHGYEPGREGSTPSRSAAVGTRWVASHAWTASPSGQASGPTMAARTGRPGRIANEKDGNVIGHERFSDSRSRVRIDRAPARHPGPHPHHQAR
ncbi:hypothetical protein [Streptomyces dangxiongensis]|uniref:hypothetical protein n=1 Tax=Streptomyces dangxiongensis TaxID=1442032 RepID=UPI0013CEC1C5|nr:hypothetical protein [Streptomyces dangxiongensis]